MTKIQVVSKWLKEAQKRAKRELKALGVKKVEMEGDQWNEKVDIEGEVAQSCRYDDMKYVFFLEAPVAQLTRAQCERAADLDRILVIGLQGELIQRGKVSLDELALNIGYLEMVLTPTELEKLTTGSVNKTLGEVKAIYS